NRSMELPRSCRHRPSQPIRRIIRDTSAMNTSTTLKCSRTRRTSATKDQTALPMSRYPRLDTLLRTLIASTSGQFRQRQPAQSNAVLDMAAVRSHREVGVNGCVADGNICARAGSQLLRRGKLRRWVSASKLPSAGICATYTMLKDCNGAGWEIYNGIAGRG